MRSWTEIYEALLREKDPAKLREQCDKAEDTIKKRFRELMMEVDVDSSAERRAISRALHRVAMIRKSLVKDVADN
jgi:hypothetical protein